MKDFAKYLTPSDEDKDWGLFLNAAGKHTSMSNIAYPSKEHPSGYYFDFNKGRTLDEYQINYISKGDGVFEDKIGVTPIKQGSLIIVRKDQWHRYKPNMETGWTENYIGFNGQLANHFLEINKVLHGANIIHCGIHEELIDTYYKIFNLILEEKPGFQQIASGLVIKLIGYIVAFQKQRQFTGKPIEKTIDDAKFYIRQNIEQTIDIKELAQTLNIGYSYFRRLFKTYTGLSPHQYCLDLKIMRAKELILTTNLSIKEIAYKLGFESIHYFSRLYKNKTGICPSDLRKG